MHMVYKKNESINLLSKAILVIISKNHITNLAYSYYPSLIILLLLSHHNRK